MPSDRFWRLAVASPPSPAPPRPSLPPGRTDDDDDDTGIRLLGVTLVFARFDVKDNDDVLDNATALRTIGSASLHVTIPLLGETIHNSSGGAQGAASPEDGVVPEEQFRPSVR